MRGEGLRDLRLPAKAIFEMKRRLVYVLPFFVMSVLPLTGRSAGNMPASGPAINLVFIGDSITEGAGVANAATQAAPVICAHELQTRMPNTPIYFSNQGHCGSTTVDYAPPGGYFTAAVAAAKKLSADHAGQVVFSIMLGTNDSANSGTNGAPASDSDYHDRLKKIVDQLLAEFPGCKVFVHYPTWYSPNTHNAADYEGAVATNRLKSYFAKIDSIAAGDPRVYRGDTEAYEDFAANYKAELNGEGGHNGIFYLHPNVIGAEKLGKFWAGALEKKLNGR